MIGLYAPTAVRAMDERAFDEGVAPSALMERAAGHLARAVVDMAGHAYGLRVSILCGKGNNGGDGAAAGRILLGAGAAVRVCLIEGEQALTDEGRDQLRRYLAIGGRVVSDPQAALSRADVAVDALLGTGASGAPRAPYGAAVDALNAAGAPVVACDIPTGVDAKTGQVPSEAVQAAVTVTLGAEKVGLRLWPARGRCGRIVAADLGIVRAEDTPVAGLLEARDVVDRLGPGPPDAHKRSRGVVLALAGSPGMTGAATLVARGALAAGVGLVTIATHEGERATVASTVPEALTVGLPAADANRAFAILAEHLERADVIAVGPGLGLSDQTIALVQRVVREANVPVVLDADGLNAFQGQPRALAEHAGPMLVTTPHQGEFARLLGMDSRQAWADRFEIASGCARDWNAVVVLKGPGTLIMAGDDRAWVNPTGSVALATGGTGDVLTGMISALLARRAQPETVAAAVYLHGLAGEIADESARPGMTATDVTAAVPRAFRTLVEEAA